MRAGGFATGILAFGALAGGCEDPPPPCIEVDLDCQMLYEPTFDNVYAMTLTDGCGSTKNACHSAAGRKGGMSFETAESAHAALLDGRVTPGDPGCSELIVRTSSPGEDYQMPPGDPLAAAARCSLIQWVKRGAPGPGEPLSTVGASR
ncbi:MAG: hypothetical protein H0T79_00880 [Deltaproteobacteria bacterium]|nr:hypothetical protein [Deltaproteobacteria bacterium]